MKPGTGKAQAGRPYASEVTDDHLVAFCREIAGLSRTGIGRVTAAADA